MKRIVIVIMLIALLLTGCANGEQIGTPETATDTAFDGAVEITLSDSAVTVDGSPIAETEESAVYKANDIVHYEAGHDFTYGEGTADDEHESSQAEAHTVIHIGKPGKYAISGKLSAGQIAVDLGEEAESDPNAVVTLILNNADITCTVAPAVIFYNVYECGEKDEEAATKDVDTSAAGANVIIADGSVNNISGSYVARIYKSYELSEDGTEVIDSKKLHKYDGAFYSKMSMNINGGEKGDGILNINAENEGLDSELHLTVNGGIININSGNDGINTNEDNISVTTLNGGELNITVNGSTGEGDGIDSNGWLVINGGKLTASACGFSGDAGIDSDKGIYINGGEITASGNMLDRIEQSGATYAVFSFASSQQGGKAYQLKNSEGETVIEAMPKNNFTHLILSSEKLTEGTYTLWQGETQFEGRTSAFGGAARPGGGNMMPPGNIEMPDGAQIPEGISPPEGEMPPEGGMPPEIPQGEIPEGTPPEKPEQNNMPRPDDMPEMPEGSTFVMENPYDFSINSKEFNIKNGGNTFMNVSPVN